MSIEKPNFEKRHREDSTPDLFEKQYNNSKLVEIDGEKLKIIDLRPPSPKTEVPVVLLPGWCATADVFKENIITLAKLGRRVMAVSAPHGIKTEAVGNYPLVELRKLAALLCAIKQEKFDKVDAVSHSEAGIFLTIGAIEKSDKFRNLIFVSSAGIIKKDNPPRLIGGAVCDWTEQTAKVLFHEPCRLGKIGKASQEMIRAIIDDPKKTWEEVMAMVNFQINDLLIELRKQGHRISIIHGVEDKIFPMSGVIKNIDKNMVDGFVSVRGTHNEIYLKPHPFTELVDNLLDAMEKKSEKEKGPIREVV